MLKTVLSPTLAPCELPAAAWAAESKADPAAGRAVFEKRCTGCHALDHDKEGPRLPGVVGRRAGSLASFPYSSAVQKSGIVWSEETLEKWLTEPDSLIPAFLKGTGK